MKADAAKQTARRESHVSSTKGDNNQRTKTKAYINKVQPLEKLRASITERAYELYLERGRREGCAEQDWLDAEREILAHTLPR